MLSRGTADSLSARRRLYVNLDYKTRGRKGDAPNTGRSFRGKASIEFEAFAAIGAIPAAERPSG